MTAGLSISAGRGGESTNPRIPAGWKVLALPVGAAVLVLFVVAAQSLSRDGHCTSARRLLRLLVLAAVPVLGPILWPAFGRRRALEPRTPWAPAQRGSTSISIIWMRSVGPSCKALLARLVPAPWPGPPRIRHRGVVAVRHGLMRARGRSQASGVGAAPPLVGTRAAFTPLCAFAHNGVGVRRRPIPVTGRFAAR